MMKKIIKKLKDLTLFDKILIGLAILVVVFVGYGIFRKSTYITVTLKVGEENVVWERWSRAWFSQLFYPGMKEKDGLGRVNAEVVSIHSYDALPLASDLYHVKKAVYLKTRIKAVYSRSSNQYTYKGLPVLIGSQIRMYLDRVLVEGLVTGIEGVVDPRENKTLLVEAQIKEESLTYQETSGTDDYIAQALSVGQKITDDQGNVAIEIIGKRVENAKKVTTTSTGGVLIGQNPLKKDVYLTLKINATKLYDRYYLFDDIPILVGQTIPINTSTLTVLPEVTKITVLE